MKQLTLFTTDETDSQQIVKPCHWKVFIDGASRGNPGAAGAGVYILKNNHFFAQHGFYLGIKTNNQAEYLALLLAVFELKKHVHADDNVHIISDSQLMIRQMKGQYRVKNDDLKILYGICSKWLIGWNISLSHVLRAQNIEADQMANVGVDKKIKPSHAFIENLKRENYPM